MDNTIKLALVGVDTDSIYCYLPYNWIFKSIKHQHSFNKFINKLAKVLINKYGRSYAIYAQKGL